MTNASLCFLLGSLVLCAGSPVPGPSESTPPAEFRFQLRKKEDGVRTVLRGKEVTFEITSPSGIGSAEAQLAAGAWPEKVVLRFHLRSLEMIQVGNERVKLTGRLHAPRSVLHYDRSGKPTEDPAEAAYTMTVTGQAGGKVIDVSLPPRFCEKATGKLTVFWIDAYRR